MILIRTIMAAMLAMGACATIVSAQFHKSSDSLAKSDATAIPDQGMITLNFPDNLSLQALVEYVGQRKGLNFLYDSALGARTVTIKTPAAIPSDSLVLLLDTVLKANGMVMVATDVPDTMRIELVSHLTPVASQPFNDPASPETVRPTLAVTRILQVKYCSVKRAQELLASFTTTGTSNVIPVPEHGILIVTDYASNIVKLEDILRIIDQPDTSSEVRFVSLQNVDTTDVAQQITQILNGKAKSKGITADARSSMTVIPNPRTNQVVIIGDPAGMDGIEQIINTLDASTDMTTAMYTFKVLSAAQADRLIRSILGETQAKRLYRSTADQDLNVLVATTTPQIHKQIADLQQFFDKPIADAQSPIRFYKLQNAKASQVLETLQGIEGEFGLEGVSVDGVAAPSRQDQPQTANYGRIDGPDEKDVNAPESLQDKSDDAKGSKTTPKSVRIHDARIMADEPSNTIIVIAPPAMQTVYEKLIQRLDIRRPQVLVEATVVSIDTTDGFQLGVEISNSNSFNEGKGKVLNFTSFGLSTVDADTGELTLKPGLGFNGAVISADIANIIIRALETDDRVKVISRPSVLINDNAKGILDSVSKVAYASVNASSTVATTSLGGYVEAGTKITISPQISEGNHLKLNYEIELSSFGDATSESLPPTKQTNSLQSEVTIPDDHTIIVGGLRQERAAENIDRTPVLGSIPGLEYLFSNRSTETRQTELFVFIHALILRDDKFEDLKVLSSDAAIRSELEPDFPSSQPVAIQ